MAESGFRVKLERLDNSLPDEAVERFNTYGLVVLELPEPPTVEQLVALEKPLGNLWYHQRSGPNGISVIEPTGNPPGFLGTMPDEHPPHTDGAYNDQPPRIVLLSCEYAEAEGGDSVLVSAAAVYQRLADKGVDLVDSLHAPDALTIDRNGSISCKAAFQRVEDDRVSVCFRMDKHSSTQGSMNSSHAIEVMSEVVSAPDLQLRTTLKRGDVLLIDNSAILHGRTEFDASSGRRRMLRANFMGNGEQKLEFGFIARRGEAGVHSAG
ncbi:TauD/TfdA family dioxygenase [Kitasatospora cineracea]|uniref:TauD/TfdA family dioxygenase n=1 Tax=Kitasatospora cineracea TaxID=88074 RepID=UPI0033C980E5